VRPIPVGQPLPEIKMPHSFMSKNSDIEMRQPGMDKTGPVPVKAPVDSLPVEQLVQQRKEGQAAPTANGPMMLMPVPVQPPAPPVNPGLAPTTGGVAK
jgi:pilus assembly protein CpaC